MLLLIIHRLNKQENYFKKKEIGSHTEVIVCTPRQGMLE